MDHIAQVCFNVIRNSWTIFQNVYKFYIYTSIEYLGDPGYDNNFLDIKLK